MTEAIWPWPNPSEQRDMSAPIPQRQPSRESRRNIFSDITPFFTVPIHLYESGLVAILKPCAVLRYVTLCRLANYRSNHEISYSMEELEKRDGVSPRSARHVNCKLQEYGLIHISKSKPMTYRIERDPTYWAIDSPLRPVLRRGARLNVER